MMNVGFLLAESFRDFIKKYSSAFLPGEIKIGEDLLHLQASMDWLEEAIKHGDGGVSSHYSVLHGKWLAPFPETTGYIIPTLFDYSYFTGNKKYFDLAVRLTSWLSDAQLDNGACMQGVYDKSRGKTAPVIFNTGQNILGWVRSFLETKEEKFLLSAKRAGDFLVDSTDQHGVWDKNLHRGIKHTINVRCSWALLLLNSILPNPGYTRVAFANLDWTLQQQTPNGWFNFGTSRKGGLPNTHFLAYTCEGFLESYRICRDKKYLDAAYLTAFKLLRIFEIRKTLYCFWDEKWKNHGKYIKSSRGHFICLTGVIQISGVWMKLYEETGDIRFANSAFKMLDYVKTLQDVSTRNKNIYGGIKGSFPIYGSYSSLMYPNWAAKFFADSIMQKINLEKELDKK